MNFEFLIVEFKN